MSRSVPVASSLSASPRPLRGASHFFGVAEDDALTAAVADCGAAGPRLAYWTRVQCRMAAVGFNRRPIGFKQRYERITERNNTWCAAPRRIATQSNAATATSQSDEAIIAGSDDDDDRRSASPMEKSGMSATSDDDEMNGGRSSAAFDCLLHAALPPDDSIDDPDNAPMCAILSSLSSSTDQLSALRRAVDAMDVSFSLSRANMVHEIAALRSSNLLLHASSESAAATIAHRDGRIAQLLMQVGEAVGIIATSNAVIEAQRAKIDEYKRDAEVRRAREKERKDHRSVNDDVL